MTQTLRLLSHGEHVRPAYAALRGETEGAAGKSAAEERPEGKLSGTPRRFGKQQEASYEPGALGWIKATYKDAIEYAGLVDELEGYALWGGAIALSGGLVFLWIAFYALLTFPRPHGGLVFVLMLCIVMASGYGVIWSLRLTIYKPCDLPIIFDRKHRKVYRILREEQAGIVGMFEPWPVKCCEYEWDLVDAEYEAEAFTTGATVNRNHYLMFLVRKSAEDATIIDSFQIGNAMLMNEAIVAGMWEHIRRFMEQGGPHLPSPDEPLAYKRRDQPTWWEACGTVSVWGSKYKQRWREETLRAVVAHVLFFVSIPAGLVIGTGNWLAHKTAVDVDWPDEVKERVGPPVRIHGRG